MLSKEVSRLGGSMMALGYFAHLAPVQDWSTAAKCGLEVATALFRGIFRDDLNLGMTVREAVSHPHKGLWGEGNPRRTSSSISKP